MSQPQQNTSSFSFENVSISFGDKKIWSEGNFAVKKGSIVAIIGSNGAGKTTLAKLLLGLLKPTSGKITLDDENIGYVPQKYDTENDFMIRGVDYVQNVAENSQKRRKTEKHQLKNDIAHAITSVNADDFARQRLSTLSGGQRQRIAIAGALTGNNDMLILDEPLSSLDIASAKDLVALLAKINRETNMTILIIAHDLGLLLPILTGAIYLVDGHAHYTLLDDAEHADYGDLLDHLKTMKVGEHEL